MRVLTKLLFAALQATESEDQQRLRFQVELEFVQCLANPNYLHCKLHKCCTQCHKIDGIFFAHSSCATRLLQGSVLRQLSAVSSLLEETWIRQISQISDVLVLPRSPAKRRIPPKDSHSSMLQVHRRPGNSPLATLHKTAHKDSGTATLLAQSTEKSAKSKRHVAENELNINFKKL